MEPCVERCHNVSLVPAAPHVTLPYIPILTWYPFVPFRLTGLVSFMLSDEMTTGSVTTSDTDKRVYASRSHAWNLQQRRFRDAFPEVSPYILRGNHHALSQTSAQHLSVVDVSLMGTGNSRFTLYRPDKTLLLTSLVDSSTALHLVDPCLIWVRKNVACRTPHHQHHQNRLLLLYPRGVYPRFPRPK